MVVFTAGFIVSAPGAGFLSDRFGARGMATAGMVVFAASLIGLLLRGGRYVDPGQADQQTTAAWLTS